MTAIVLIFYEYKQINSDFSVKRILMKLDSAKWEFFFPILLEPVYLSAKRGYTELGYKMIQLLLNYPFLCKRNDQI